MKICRYHLSVEVLIIYYINLQNFVTQTAKGLWYCSFNFTNIHLFSYLAYNHYYDENIRTCRQHFSIYNICLVHCIQGLSMIDGFFWNGRKVEKLKWELDIQLVLWYYGFVGFCRNILSILRFNFYKIKKNL